MITEETTKTLKEARDHFIKARDLIVQASGDVDCKLCKSDFDPAIEYMDALITMTKINTTLNDKEIRTLKGLLTHSSILYALAILSRIMITVKEIKKK